MKQEVKHSYYNLSIKGEKYQLDLSKLLMSWSVCFLSQSKYFVQLSHRKNKTKAKVKKVCRSNWKIAKNRGIIKHIWREVIQEKLMFRILWNTLKDGLCHLRNESVSMKVFLLNIHEATHLFDLGKPRRHLIYYTY